MSRFSSGSPDGADLQWRLPPKRCPEEHGVLERAASFFGCKKKAMHLVTAPGPRFQRVAPLPKSSRPGPSPFPVLAQHQPPFSTSASTHPARSPPHTPYLIKLPSGKFLPTRGRKIVTYPPPDHTFSTPRTFPTNGLPPVALGR